MNRKQFELALNLLTSSDWKDFEVLASRFIASEFTNLRTMASQAGDGGRDSELFSCGNNPLVAIQYSIRKDWQSKVRETVKRLKTTFPTIKILIYITNQIIGAQADSLRSAASKEGFALDIRDRNWLTERFDFDEIKLAAAQELFDKIARPYLEGEKIIETKAYSLSNKEARAALLYLGLQWQDDISGKGLTKLSYEALVRAILRNTDVNNRLKRTEIHQRIKNVISSNIGEEIESNIDLALTRLTKKYIRHWQKVDEFCLMFEESERLKVRLSEKECEEEDFKKELIKLCELCLKEQSEVSNGDLEELFCRVQRVLNQFLFERGELFASAVLSGNLKYITFDALDNITIKDLDKNRTKGKLISILPSIVAEIIKKLLNEPSDITQKYLRCLADSYTLYAFLRETSDVQNATRKIFSYGTVWLDTSVLLPLFAETWLEEDSQKLFTRLIKVASEAGIEFRMTPGVVNEIVSHIKISIACSHVSTTWRGKIPFLYHYYIHLGYDPGKFLDSIQIFCGPERPEDDIADYLNETFNIKVESLEDKLELFPKELRFAIERLWTEAHEIRKRKAEYIYDDSIKAILIKHDVENYVGILAIRQKEEGFRSGI